MVKKLLRNYYNKVFKVSCGSFKKIYKRARFLKVTYKYDIKNFKREFDLNDIMIKFYNIDFSSKKLFHFSNKEKNYIIRQKILIKNPIHILVDKLIDSMISKKKLIGYYPSDMTENINSKDIDINKIASRVLWTCSIIKSVILAFIKVFRNFIFSLIFTHKNKENSVFFLGFSKNMIPDNNQKFKNYQSVSWYADYFIRDNIKFFFHDNKKKKYEIKYKDNIINYSYGCKPKIKNIFKNIKYLLISIYSIIKSIISLNIYELIIMDDYVDYLLFKYSDNKNLSKKYVFEFGSYLRKPLWTYACIEKGILVEMLCYSINDNLTFNKGKGYLWNKILNWPKYLIWSDQQKNNFHNYNEYKNSEYEIVGLIPLNDIDNNQKITTKKKILSIFDIPGMKTAKSQHAVAAHEWLYYSPINHYNFLMNIGEVAKEYDIQIVIKRKKKRYDQWGSLDKRYEIFYKKYNVIEFDRNMSPIKLVEQSDFVISQPFSTPSLIANLLNKPSCYYDPTFDLDQNNDLCHRIELVNGKENLRKWLKNKLH